MLDQEQLRYPIGRFQIAPSYTAQDRAQLLNNFATLPQQVADAAQQIDQHQAWEISYRPGGWTARQVVHHLADSHLNAYQRFKHTLTEDHPILRGYDEGAWSELEDYSMEPAVSISLLHSLHQRIHTILHKATSEQWSRKCKHPSMNTVEDLAGLLAAYDWHGRHHLAHLHLVLQTAESHR